MSAPVDGSDLATPGGRARVRLRRFRVREGASARVQEWLQFLRDHADAVLETLEPERMYLETIVSEHVEGVQYLYWYTVQGEGGAAVTQSEHWLDRAHLAYWRECIDDDHPPQELTTEVVMVPQRVRDAMRPRHP